MFPKSHLVFLATLLLTTTQLSAQIATDGTLGIKTDLTGPNFQIPDNLGQQFGGNLFHSFREFNINTGQSATFTGPNTVQNILTRVTGGQSSLIDGTLHSEIPNANLYLLNPSGILFGKNASLDISGSFHASTADYIRLTDGSSFYAHPDSNPALLSVARPEAFGFLSNRPAAIEIQGSVLRVTEGKDLSMIGGDLTIKDGILHAPSGRINLASVASIGEVIPKTDADDVNLGMKGFKELGTINLWQSMIDPRNRPLANIDVSGDNAGQIFIRAGQLLANNAWVFADTYGDKSGLIDISVAGPISLTNSTRITAGNLGTARQPGLINITTATKLFVGFKSEELDTVLSQPFVAEFLINEGFPSGMTITDLMRDDYFQQFFVTAVSSVISTANFGQGIGGDIKITTPSLEVSYGLIETATMGSSKAGNIQVNASQVNLHDYGLISAAVNATVEEKSGFGHGGNIGLFARQISLSNNSSISVSTSLDTSGDTGNIDLKTQELVLKDRGFINSFSYGSGKAGSINIAANKIWLTDKSAIYTETDFSEGSNINITAQRLYAVDSSIITRTFSGNPQAGAGKFNFKGPKYSFVILDNSQILATAKAGPGGYVSITASQYLPSSASVIDVSSEFNIDGQVLIDTPGVNLNGIFAGLPRTFPKLELSLLSRCSLFSKDHRNRFIITARDILPRSPEDWRTHSLRLPRRGR